jgi:hypothetical protein
MSTSKLGSTKPAPSSNVKQLIGKPDRVFLGAFEKRQKATISFVMYVCLPALNNIAPNEHILMKCDM